MSKPRSLVFGFALAVLGLPLTLGGTGGCSAPNADLGQGLDDVTDVPHSDVKDQSSNNCWIYATTGWVESLHLAATGEKLNLSETYLTYWNFFDQIVAGDVTGGMVEEGGSWGQAADAILKYGLVAEADFIPPEANAILSTRQAEALKTVNLALKSGELRTGAARRNRALVRSVLDRAFHLTTKVIADLDKTFGRDVSRSLDRDYDSKPLPAGVAIRKATAFKARLRNPATGRFNVVSVADAIGTHKSPSNLEHRNGVFAWQEVAYPKRASGRREFLKRVQRALHDHQPVVINWTIDFAALTSDGRFADIPTEKAGEEQGGHVVLGYDYAVDNVPGFGSLEAGVDATPAQLEAALADQAQVRLLRVKNSWSPTYRTLPAPAPGGYHDLYMKYLNGPMKMCDHDAEDHVIPSSCQPGVPLDTIVLPAGY